MDGEPREITGNAGVTVFVRLSRVQELSGLGRSTIYRLMALQLFPRAVRLGPRAVGWRLGDIAAWGAARPALGLCTTVSAVGAVGTVGAVSAVGPTDLSTPAAAADCSRQ